MWSLPKPRRPEQLGGESTNVSNGATYRGRLRKEKSDRRSLLLAKIMMVSGIGTVLGYLVWQALR